MSIQENIELIRNQIPAHVAIIAISKTKPVEEIMEAYDAGLRVFGENKAQELTTKHKELPGDITWHFIGHLQTNKVKYLAPFIGMIHSVDSLKLLIEINREAKKSNRIIDCLLQFHIATEETKFGLDLDEAKHLLTSPEFPGLNNILIRGVMGMASLSEDELLVRSEFRQLHNYFNNLKKEFFLHDNNFIEISMGMSGDYNLAIEEGSTMLRLGTVIFGERRYQ